MCLPIAWDNGEEPIMGSLDSRDANPKIIVVQDNPLPSIQGVVSAAPPLLSSPSWIEDRQTLGAKLL